MDSARLHIAGLRAGVFLAGGLVLLAMLFTSAWVSVPNPQMFTLKRCVKRHAESDVAGWTGCCPVEAENLPAARHELKEDLSHVQAFLLARVKTTDGMTAIRSSLIRRQVCLRHAEPTGNNHGGCLRQLRAAAA